MLRKIYYMSLNSDLICQRIKRALLIQPIKVAGTSKLLCCPSILFSVASELLFAFLQLWESYCEKRPISRIYDFLSFSNIIQKQSKITRHHRLTSMAWI